MEEGPRSRALHHHHHPSSITTITPPSHPTPTRQVGVSTNRIHARGPVGVEGLLIYKYLLYGEGQIVAEYSGQNAKSFKHNQLPLDNKDAKPEFGIRRELVVAAIAAVSGLLLGMRLRR